VLALTRRLRDPEAQATLDESYEGALAGLEPAVFAREGMLAVLQRVMVPRARFAFGKAMDLFKTSVVSGRARLQQLADVVSDALPDAKAKEAVRAAATAALTLLGEGAQAAAETAKAQCGTAEVIKDFTPATLQRLFECVKGALGTGVQSGAETASTPPASGDADKPSEEGTTAPAEAVSGDIPPSGDGPPSEGDSPP
jgi:hypothetical protein